MLIKRTLLYSCITLILFGISYFLHHYYLDNTYTTFSFNLKSIYLFHSLGSLAVILTMEILFTTSLSFKDQLGFIYLGSTALKVVLFFIFFSEILLLSHSVSKSEKITLLIPLIIFMIYEVIMVVNILNRSVKS